MALQQAAAVWYRALFKECALTLPLPHESDKAAYFSGDHCP